MNQKNSLGLNSCFLDLNDPIQLFKAWMEEAKKTEPNDPNAFSLATADKNGMPSVRIVLLKDFGKDGFTFYTNLDSPKSLNIEKNPKAEMCFYWKSLQRQVRVFGSINKVSNEIADKYFDSRDYGSKIGAWESEQSKILQNRDDILEIFDGFKKNTRIENELKFTLGLILKYNIINQCYKKAEHFINLASNSLSIFPESDEKKILKNLTTFSLERSF